MDKALYVLATFDEDTSNTMALIYKDIERCGIVGSQTKDIPYHLTLGSFPVDRTASITKRVALLASEISAFQLDFNHIGLFGLRVLFLGPDVNKDLLYLQEAICQDVIKDHRGWTAHIGSYKLQ